MLDLSPVLYKAHYGNDRIGENSISYRAIKYIMELILEYDSKYFCIALDGDRDKLKRKEVYPEYKSNRNKERPIEFKTQLPIILEFLDLMGIRYIQHDASESDDLLASLSKIFSDSKIKNIICTSDKDLIQCKNKYASVATIKRSGVKILTKKDFPVDPKSFIQFQAIVGDGVDCVPGCKGIGKLGAKEIIDEYKTLENVYKNLDNLKPRHKKLLDEQRKDVFLSRWLCRLHTKLDLGNIEDYTYSFSYDKCLEFLEKYGMETSLYNKLAQIEFDF